MTAIVKPSRATQLESPWTFFPPHSLSWPPQGSVGLTVRVKQRQPLQPAAQGEVWQGRAVPPLTHRELEGVVKQEYMPCTLLWLTPPLPLTPDLWVSFLLRPCWT